MKIRKANPKKPISIIIYGHDGLGKSTFGAKFPNPIFLGPEIDGADFLTDMNGNPVDIDDDSKTYKGIMDAIESLIKDSAGYKTIVIDSLDWVEAELQQEIKVKYKVDNLNDAAGGYGGGYREAYEMQLDLMNKISKLKKKMNVVLVSHAKNVKFSDPKTQETYDRIELKLHESANISPRSMWREAVDAVFLIDQDVTASSEKSGVKTKFSNKRWLRTSRTERFDAKNRWPSFPDNIRFEENADIYSTIMSYITNSSEDVYKECLALYKEAGLDKPKLLEYIEENKESKQRLTSALNRMKKGE